MPGTTYDIVTVGGGLAGSALAKAMAERGARVLVLEREKQFRDRVRGEYLNPWGVAEMKRLGLDETLVAAHANEAPWVIGFGPDRDLVSSTPQGLPALKKPGPGRDRIRLPRALHSRALRQRLHRDRAASSRRRPTDSDSHRVLDRETASRARARGRARRVRPSLSPTPIRRDHHQQSLCRK